LTDTLQENKRYWRPLPPDKLEENIAVPAEKV